MVSADSPVAEPIYGAPIRLKIPKLKIDVKVLALGMTSLGDMSTPSNLKDVGWYKNGPHPGEQGSSVITGHLGVGGPGVFMDLHVLTAGDSLSIVDDKGQTNAFVVRETRIYNPNDWAQEAFTSSEGSHLNLITCTGTWNEVEKQFSNRLIVFADKVK
jgi:LPXTG-site transpeptidase (sortase) family protein